MSNFLFTLPSEKSNSIPALRKVADRHCRELADLSQIDPDSIWESAIHGNFGVLWGAEAVAFKKAFLELRDVETCEMESLMPI
jgi:hypothetical protein